MVSLIIPNQTEREPLDNSFRYFLGLMLAMVAVFVLGMTILIRSDYQRTSSQVLRQLSHVSELFAQSVESSLNVANVKMWVLIDRIAAAPLTTETVAAPAFAETLQDTVMNTPQIDSLLVIDPEGTVIWATAESIIGRNLSDRGYFQTALTLSRGQFAVGIPVTARGSGRRVTPIAWPIRGPRGEMRGVIASALGEEYFEGLLSRAEVGSDMHVSIVTENGETAFAKNDDPSSSDADLFEASTPVPALGVTISATRGKTDALVGFRHRTAAFAVLATILFFSAIGAAIVSRVKSVQLAESLKRSQRDKLRILNAQREFETIFENVADGIVIFDEDRQLQRSNKKARELLGSKSDGDAVERLGALLPPVSEIEEDYSVHRIELPDLDHEELYQSVQCRVMKLETNGQSIAYCVLADVSAEERLAAARIAFVTSVNHELRTPLTSLAGSLDVLSDRFADDLPGGAAKLVAMASRNAERLLMLVNDILTLQAIDQGQLNVRMEPVSVADALQEAISTNSGYGLGAQVKLVCDLSDCDQNAFVQADGTRLQQIFSNLISNAMKYSPRHGEVRIGAACLDGKVTFWVKDNGPGIPQEAGERIFERFTKPVHAKGVQASGTGLGLAITKELVERQGATISFESITDDEDQDRSGTTFRVTFNALNSREFLMGIAS